MKTIILTFATVFAFTANVFAQTPKNVKSETKTTVTTIKDSKGEKKLVKTEKTQEVQKVALGEEKANTLNIPQIVDNKVDVIKTTEVSIDGQVQEVNVDRSAYYMFDGQKYQMQSDKSGYTLTSPDNKPKGILRKTSNNNYIYVHDNKVAIGFYDTDGNFILETYDSNSDSVKREKFEIVK